MFIIWRSIYNIYNKGRYIDVTWVYIEYRETGSTEWIDVDMYNIEGAKVGFIVNNDSDYPNEAYFDLPGDGTYDFRATDILGGIEGDGLIEDCVVEYTNQSMGDIYGHDLTISYLSSIHGFM